MAAIGAFFGDFELQRGPGLVEVSAWRGNHKKRPVQAISQLVAGVGRKRRG
jgi:hypothetical protein